MSVECPHCGKEPRYWSREESVGGTVYPPDEKVPDQLYALKEKWSEGNGALLLLCDTKDCPGSSDGFEPDDDFEWEYAC